MRKLLLLSIVFATILIPLIAARERSAMRGLKKALALMLAFVLFYMLGMVVLYPFLS